MIFPEVNDEQLPHAKAASACMLGRLIRTDVCQRQEHGAVCEWSPVCGSRVWYGSHLTVRLDVLCSPPDGGLQKTTPSLHLPAVLHLSGPALGPLATPSWLGAPFWLPAAAVPSLYDIMVRVTARRGGCGLRQLAGGLAELQAQGLRVRDIIRIFLNTRSLFSPKYKRCSALC